MASSTWKQLRDDGAFELLGELFPDVTSSHTLLEDLGVNPAVLIPFAPPLAAADWWRAVCQTLDRGRIAGVRPCDLLVAAAARYPGHTELRNLAGSGAPAAPVRVLCLMSAPLDEARIRLGAEQRIIQEAEGRSAGRLAVQVHPATRVADILPQLDAALPQIVHFAGHGTDDGRLLFEDETGASAAVPIEALIPAFELRAPINCVVLNSCWTAAYAEGLLKCAHTVVGTVSELDDDAGLVFAQGFYTSLAHSPDIERACAAGRAALRLNGHLPEALHHMSRAGSSL
ncbi:CHAT domain-containing protein [Streptomyces endophyticus]|uniref:CHAT domain-containing protein n=1 Tax=Streptomyces endophyticus TaxID=714166 RepID=A0ABU6FG28_9ACTN|nr:CHAT domain-containing protein [Streptomyces endophyticus]MEB8343001.1 CHAT domain-containing protein [Streptomyces endophyticus]